MNELSTLAPRLVALTTDDVLQAFLAGRKRTTMEAYRFDVQDFARFLGIKSPGLAVETLLTMGHGSANRAVLAYRANLVERGLATATVARRIAALRSMTKLARQLGRIAWSIDIESPKVQKYRDTEGPGLDGYRRMRAVARSLATTWQGKRDLALLALLHDSCLRREECCTLDFAHVDLEAGRVSVLGKGHTDREWITISPQAKAALVDWISARGECQGPLFTRCDRAAYGRGRLTGESVNRIVGRLGRKAGLTRRVKAHGLRHQGITRALDLTNGNIRMAQKLSRHADPRTLMKYDDNRRDDAGTLAAMLGNDSED